MFAEMEEPAEPGSTASHACVKEATEGLDAK